MGETHESLLKVVRHCQESLDKYTENRNDGKLLHYLQKLYKLPIKVVHLEETGVGRTVNGLRKLGGDVGDSAKSLVAKWKEMVVGEQEEEDDDDDDDEDDDEEDGYQTGEEQSESDDGHEEKVKHSSSHRKSDNRDDRDKSKRHKESSSKTDRHLKDKERDKHNGHNKHKSHKRKVESEESGDESPKKRRRNDDEHRHKTKKRDSDEEEVRSKEKKHKERRRDSDEEDARRREKKHKSDKRVDSDDEEVRKKDKKHKYERSDSDEEVKLKEKKHKSDKNKKKSRDLPQDFESKSGKKEKHSDSSKDKHKSPRKEDSKKHEHSSKTKDNDKKSREKDKTKSEEKKKKTSLNGNILHAGIDSGSGASFAEALGMCEPSSSSKNVTKKKPEKKEKYKPEDVVPKLLKEPTVEPVDINLSSLLPPITPNYRPLGNLISSENQPKKVLSESETLSNIISSKNQRTKVYSGNKMALGKVPSLFEICTRILQDNIDALEYTGGVPYSILKPILEKANPNQLYMMEHHNPYLVEETDELWQLHCQKEFRNKRREEMETWREMYLRCLDERDAKLKALTANIKQSQDKSLPVRMTKLAYVDAVAKPPRNIARKQAKNGTAFDVRKPAMTPTARLNSLATSGDAGKIAVPNPGSRAVERVSGHAKPKKAPLMLKSITSFKNRFKR